MNILVTGAAGYIGSHVALQLLQSGYGVVAVDNFSNSDPGVYERVEQLAGKPLESSEFVRAELDVRNTAALTQLVQKHQPVACLHFAAYKAVAESQEHPSRYWNNNVSCLTSALEAMDSIGARKLVFSSSATVYGLPKTIPVDETAPMQPASVYAETKLAGEQILASLSSHAVPWSVATLRYFNPIGAHPSGLLGEAPRGIPNNLMPYVTQTAAGLRECLSVFGTDYPTRDGSCIRDYIHVMDLADGHLAALKQLIATPGSLTVNLGTGVGTSVLELLSTFERVTGVNVPKKLVGRRSGDVAEYFASCELAYSQLGWRATRSLDDMCADSWNWQRRQGAM